MNGKTDGKRGPRRVGALAAVAAIAILATACGSSDPSPSGVSLNGASLDSTVLGGSVTYTQELALARCMRSHGAPDLPSPTASGGFDLTTTANGPKGAVDIDSSQIQAAYGACRHLLPGGGPSVAELRQRLRQQQQAQQQAFPALMRFAQCMRSHGVPGFPDPQASGQVTPASSKDAGLNPASPRFQAAVRACQHELPAGVHLSIHKHVSVGADG